MKVTKKLKHKTSNSINRVWKIIENNRETFNSIIMRTFFVIGEVYDERFPKPRSESEFLPHDLALKDDTNIDAALHVQIDTPNLELN